VRARELAELLEDDEDELERSNPAVDPRRLRLGDPLDSVLLGESMPAVDMVNERRIRELAGEKDAPELVRSFFFLELDFDLDERDLDLWLEPLPDRESSEVELARDMS
jgi:hypothetical protein